MIDSIAEGNVIVSKYINKKIEDLEIEKQNILSELNLLNEKNNFTDNNFLIEYIKDINEKLNTKDFEQLKLVCHTIIDKIVITDKNIDIHYKI